MSSMKYLLGVLIALVGVFVFMKEGNQTTQEKIVLDKSSVVLAFGDSLTYGFGAPKEYSYPSILERKTSLEIVNAGINGEVSSQGLARLKTLLSKREFDLVILCHGGNDLIKKLPQNNLKSNLLEMIRLIQNNGAKVLFVGVADFEMFDFETNEVYDQIAQETGVVYDGITLQKVESDRSLKSDYVHPNAKGYEVMANAFYEKLEIRQ